MKKKFMVFLFALNPIIIPNLVFAEVEKLPSEEAAEDLALTQNENYLAQLENQGINPISTEME